MKKKIVALCLVLALALTAIGGATLAYFTDTEQKTNTFTIGNIDIVIEEDMKDTNGQYVDWKPSKLYPIADEKAHLAYEHGYNKIVRTFNRSESQDAAYIRTIVLFEKNAQVTHKCSSGCLYGLHFSYVNAPGSGACADGQLSRGSKNEVLKDTVKIGDDEYWVVVFTDAEEKAIPYNESLHTLSGVWIDKDVTTEQMAGWGEDGDVDIIVLSQGIQAANLTHAEAMAELGTVNQALIDELYAA